MNKLKLTFLLSGTLLLLPLGYYSLKSLDLQLTTSTKQTKYYRCNKCGRRHLDEPIKCEGCGHTNFFVTYQ